QLETLLAQSLAGIARDLATLPQRILATSLDVVAVLALSSMLLSQRRRLFAGLLVLSPPRYRRVVRAVVRELWRRLGSYVGAKLTVMAIVGGATALILWPLGVPSPLLLGMVVALGELVPRIGPWLARLPLFALAALTGWVPLAVTVASSIVLQNLKGLVIAPLVEGERLDVHPVVAVLAVLAGAELFGLAGAALALPAAAGLDVLWETFVAGRLLRVRSGSVPAEGRLPAETRPGAEA
ncbi:MAG: AI-2E family transporter, partial [Thermomicrobium sp.]|nr:AI-2E family transporter [Thermomicrobium sp.]